MKPLVQPLSRIALALCLLTPLSQAMAADVANPVEAQHQEDRRACMAMTTASVVSREACLREAGAVREAALGGTLPEESSPAAMRRNALSRCEVHQDPVDRSACVRMVQGEGVSQGSVEGGGIIRETITVLEPAAPVEPASAPPVR